MNAIMRECHRQSLQCTSISDLMCYYNRLKGEGIIQGWHIRTGKSAFDPISVSIVPAKTVENIDVTCVVK